MARKTGSSNTGYALEERKRPNGKPFWRVRVWVDDPATGTKTRQTIGTFATKTEAHREGREAANLRDRGTLLNPSDVTVADLLDSWLSTKAGSISANSHRDYETASRLHIKPAMGAVRLQSLTPSQVQRQYDAWRDGGMSPAMTHRCHMVLRQALAFAVRDGMVFRNVAADATKPSIQKTGMKVWTPEQVRRFLQATMNRPVLFRVSAKSDATPKPVDTRPDDLSPLWHLLVLEGLRRGEALGLRWKDINWDRGSIHISQTVIADKSNRGAATIQHRTKTKAGSRSVRLTSDTLSALRDHQDRQRFSLKAAGKSLNDDDLIIRTANGTPVNPSNVTRSFERLAELAGLPRIRVHDLRHTHATLLLKQGIPAKVVSERLGHANIAITLDTYSHVLPDMQDDAADAVSRIVNLSSTG